MVEHLEQDILILGGGGAGLMASLRSRQANSPLRIAVAAKGLIGQSGCTRLVQGGYNAVLDPLDSFDLHYSDTIRGGSFINEVAKINWACLVETWLEHISLLAMAEAQSMLAQRLFPRIAA